MSTNRGTIFNIQHFSLNDGPGIRTVVFFKGCPLSCIWCHNPESKSKNFELSLSAEKCVMCGKCAHVCDNNAHSFNGNSHNISRNLCVFCGKCNSVCPTAALEIIGKDYCVEEVMSELSKDDIFFGNDGGVTFSGGEPFMQFEFLYELLKNCKKRGYSTCIETSGYTKPENIIKASEFTDIFLFDFKETNPANHKKFVGADNRQILENLEVLSKLNATVVLRCPIIPDCNDNEVHFSGIGKIAEKYVNIHHIELEPYHSLGEHKKLNLGQAVRSFFEPSESEKSSWLECISKYTRKPIIFA